MNRSTLLFRILFSHCNVITLLPFFTCKKPVKFCLRGGEWVVVVEDFLILFLFVKQTQVEERERDRQTERDRETDRRGNRILVVLTKWKY